MTDRAKFEKAMLELNEKHQADLDKRGAINMIVGEGFVGYVGQNKERWWCDIWAWGVNHSKIYRDTKEEVEQAAYKLRC